MFNYNIDTTEGGYDTLTGSFKTFDELKKSLLIGGRLPDCVGTIESDDAPENKICIASIKELGVYLKITRNEDEYLSLSGWDAMERAVDVWGDDLLISEGFFIPEELAWDGIEKFLTGGAFSDKIQWISLDDLPEDGNYNGNEIYII